MRCVRSSATTRSIARARASPGCAGAFPTAVLAEICGWTVDDERVRVWTNVWMRSWTKDLVATQARADDAHVAWRRGKDTSGGGADRCARYRVHRVLLPAPFGRVASALLRNV